MNSLVDIGIIFARAIQGLEQILEEADVRETTSMSVGGLVALLYKPKGSFKGLKIQANEVCCYSMENNCGETADFKMTRAVR